MVAVVFFQIENARGEKAWSLYVAERTAIGDPPRGLDYFPPPVPDEDNFAMTPLLAPLSDQVLNPKTLENKLRDPKGFKRLLSTLPDWKVWDGESSLIWQKGQVTDIYELLDSKKPIIAKATILNMTTKQVALEILDELAKYPGLKEIRKASRWPYFQFKANYNALLGPELPHQKYLERIQIALFYEASANLVLEKSQKALEGLKLMLLICKTLQHDRLISSHISSIYRFYLAIQIIRDGIVMNAWGEAQLKTIEQELKSFDWLTSHDQAMRGELALKNALIEEMHSGNFRFIGSTKELGEAIAIAAAPRGWIRKNQLEVNQFYHNYIFRTVSPATKKINAPNLSAFRHHIASIMETSYRSNHFISFRMIIPYWTVERRLNYSRYTAIAQTAADFTRLAIALELHALKEGGYPSGLNALNPTFINGIPLDIMTGKPLLFQSSNPRSYRIQSMGWDWKSNAGFADSEWLWGKRDGWVWQMEN